MPKTPKEMGDAIARNLPEKTGKTYEQWVALAKKSGPKDRNQLAAWLKSEHNLGTVTAKFIAADASGKSLADTYGDEGALLDGMYKGIGPPSVRFMTGYPRRPAKWPPRSN